MKLIILILGDGLFFEQIFVALKLFESEVFLIYSDIQIGACSNESFFFLDNNGFDFVLFRIQSRKVLTAFIEMIYIILPVNFQQGLAFFYVLIIADINIGYPSFYLCRNRNNCSRHISVIGAFMSKGMNKINHSINDRRRYRCDSNNSESPFFHISRYSPLVLFIYCI